MVDTPRSSFIPRDSGMTPGTVRKKHTYHMFSIIGTAALVGSLALAGVSFYLKYSAEQHFESVRTALIERKNEFDPELLNELRTFERQIKAADMLLSAHISPMRLLNALEAQTSRNVRLVSLSLEHTPNTQALVTLEGETLQFGTLALQKDQVARDTLLKNLQIEEVAMPDSSVASSSLNGIRFTLRGELDREAMLYDAGTYTYTDTATQPFTDMNGFEVPPTPTDSFSTTPSPEVMGAPQGIQAPVVAPPTLPAPVIDNRL